MTVADALANASALLAAAGVENATRDARVLLCAAASLNSASVVADPGMRVPEADLARFNVHVRRRALREPVSRILGYRAFWKDEFAVVPGVLDPRPETELIVEEAISKLATRRQEPLSILDLGTGSGAILCSLLREFPAATGLGVDRSENACKAAAVNLQRLGMERRGQVLQSDWTALKPSGWDLIVSNPPYIATPVIAALDPEVRDWDPLEALDGGFDGLDAYRGLGEMAANSLRPSGLALFEIGYDQESGATKVLEKAGLRVLECRRDLSGHPRVLAVNLM